MKYPLRLWLWLPLSLWERGLGGEVAGWRAEPHPAFGHPPLRGEGLSHHAARWREQSFWLWLWLPLSSRERGLGGEVAGGHRNASLAIHV